MEIDRHLSVWEWREELYAAPSGQGGCESFVDGLGRVLGVSKRNRPTNRVEIVAGTTVDEVEDIGHDRVRVTLYAKSVSPLQVVTLREYLTE